MHAHGSIDDLTPVCGSLGSWPRCVCRTPALLFVFYLACYVIATFPAVLTFGTTLPSPNDPLQHLWIMRWYKQCVLASRLPFECADLQYPLGAPLGHFSPLLLQSVQFFVASSLVHNDVLCYNLISAVGFLSTAIASFLLARHVTQDRLSACLAGLLTMLSGPVMLHGLGHVELIYVGGFALFLLAWIRFIDEPSRVRLAAAVGAYWLATMCAAYFAVLSVIPAALYVAHAAGRAGRSWRSWCGSTAVWLAAFIALCLPGLCLLFASQLWIAWQGDTLERTTVDTSGVPLTSYIVPTSFHALGRVLKPRARAEPDLEVGSYLGFVTIVLIAVTAFLRTRFKDRTFWWGLVAILMTLSLGCSTVVGGQRFDLPAAWIRQILPAFRLLRSTCRFNLLVAVCAAVPAAVGFRTLAECLQTTWARRGLFVCLVALTLWDLSLHPAQDRTHVPPLPGAYAIAIANNPTATIVDAPQFSSGSPAKLNALAGYWQSQHHGRTTAGYSGVPNTAWDHLMYFPSPFAAEYLASPAYLLDPSDASIDLIHHVSIRDYVWLYLRVHRLDHVVLHRDKSMLREVDVDLGRLQAALREAISYEDPSAVVYDRSLLNMPLHPTLLCTDGWGQREKWNGRGCRLALRRARLAVYNPDPSLDLVLILDAASVGTPRRLFVTHGSATLAQWIVLPGDAQILVSPPFRLPAGQGELSLDDDSAEIVAPAGKPRQSADRPNLRVGGICLKLAERGL
jgi:hypothetical protein